MVGESGEKPVALTLAVADGSLEAYLQYDRKHHGRDATDFLSNSIVAACILADVEPLCTLGVSDCDQLGLDEYAFPQTVVVAKASMRTVNLENGTKIDVPRHYGDYLKSREKNLWSTQMEVEIQRLLAIPVWLASSTSQRFQKTPRVLTARSEPLTTERAILPKEI